MQCQPGQASLEESQNINEYKNQRAGEEINQANLQHMC